MWKCIPPLPALPGTARTPPPIHGKWQQTQHELIRRYFYLVKAFCKVQVEHLSKEWTVNADHILYVLSAILKWIVPVMHCCSEDEAESLGIFFSELFKLLNYWCKVGNWNKEC